jgi:hypothetical protein
MMMMMRLMMMMMRTLDTYALWHTGHQLYCILIAGLCAIKHSLYICCLQAHPPPLLLIVLLHLLLSMQHLHAQLL